MEDATQARLRLRRERVVLGEESHRRHERNELERPAACEAPQPGVPNPVPVTSILCVPPVSPLDARSPQCRLAHACIDVGSRSTRSRPPR